MDAFENLDDVLTKWWNNGQPNPILDLAHVDQKVIGTLPSKLRKEMTEHIVDLVLPHSLTSMHSQVTDWLSTLDNLRSISLPNYKNKYLNLKKARPKNPFVVWIIRRRNQAYLCIRSSADICTFVRR